MTNSDDIICMFANDAKILISVQIEASSKESWPVRALSLSGGQSENCTKVKSTSSVPSEMTIILLMFDSDFMQR